MAVDSAARQSVYDVIVCDVGAQRHGGGDYAEAAHDALYLLLRQVGLLERRSDHYPTPPRPRDEYLRWLLIEPHPRLPELVVENLEVSTLERVDDIQHHVSAADDVEDLAAPTLAFGSPLDEARQVEDLDLGATVFHQTGYASQCGEGEVADVGVSLCQLGD